MSVTQRKQWIAIAVRYPAMNPEKQQRLQERMINWSRLSPAERQRARKNYQELQKLPPTKRQEVVEAWRRYKESGAPAEQVGATMESTITGSEAAEEPAQSSETEQHMSK